MANISVRNLGGLGVIADIHSYDLPLNAVSAAVNVRFENGTIRRAPVMRRVFEFTSYPAFTPGYLFSIPPLTSGVEALVTVANDYSKIYSVIGATVTDISAPSGITAGDTLEPYSHTFLGGVAYINRKSNAPLQKSPADGTFITLANWPTGTRCAVLRSYKDFLIALNIRKAAVEYPSMVKWSTITPYGAPPPSWDPTITTNSAGENILNQMKGPILDGVPLRDGFCIYAENEVWTMNYVGGGFIFDFRKTYDDVGVINTNCVVEVDGMHYVFGKHDIYRHDGASTPQSIIHGKNKDFVFSSIIKDFSYLCFTTHDTKLNEIHFNYPSQDRLVGFRNPTTGCNRSAVYNYRRDTWSFYDQPNVLSSTNSSVTTGLSYEGTSPFSYEELGGTYAGDGDNSEKHTIFVSRLDPLQGITNNRLLGLDLLNGGRLAKPLETELYKPAFIERTGIDLDEKGIPLTTYKSLLTVYPQIATRGGSQGVQMQFGSAQFSGSEPVWDTPQVFDPATNHKLDCRVAGRYLGYRLYHTGLDDFSFSGFDARLTARGLR